MAVQVAPSVDVCQADGLATLHGGPTVAHGVSCATYAPITVAVLNCGNSCHRLLSAT